MAMVPSKNWQPGHGEDEEELFPHAIYDEFITTGMWDWNKPNWAKNNPKYEGYNWLNQKREEIDVWGCYWNRIPGDNATMGHPGRPSLTDWADLDEYIEKKTPDPFDKSQYTPFFLESAKGVAKRKYRICMLGHLGPMQTGMNMRGFTTFLIDHRKHPDKIREFNEFIIDWMIQNMDAWIKYGADPHGFLLVEDLGTQNGPFLGPKMFREFYEPVYSKLCDAAHERGCELHQHCCGKVDPIIPTLIDCGLDSLEFDAPRMTGYPDLKQFRGKIMFWGCVDIQTIYPNGTPEDCEREVWHMMRNLGTSEGGYGAYFYAEPHVLNIPKENIKAFNKGLKKYGRYSKIPSKWWDYPLVEKWPTNIVPPLPPGEAE
ncbi:MAG: hypothetical protein GF383_11850 [Candidatus Lokiarchaeota archaeon]|nr:hypothetical protein [Candidatus Lokiarchaeota archaeon]MBD3341554.1 hypothetical protein [Candidatus Lokiarchaeota archaeon]